MEKYYKKYIKCKFCGEEYGLDYAIDDLTCPKCKAKLFNYKNRNNKKWDKKK